MDMDLPENQNTLGMAHTLDSMIVIMYWLLDALYEYAYIIYYMCVYNKHNICI